MSAMREYFRSHFPTLFERQNMNHNVHSCWKKVHDIKYCPSIIWFSQCDMTINTPVVLNFFGTGY